MKSLDKCSSQIEDVVEAYFHSLTSRFPRKRYQIGNDSIFGFIPFSLFPTDIQDLFFDLIALITRPPKPNCVK